MKKIILLCYNMFQKRTEKRSKCAAMSSELSKKKNKAGNGDLILTTFVTVSHHNVVQRRLLSSKDKLSFHDYFTISGSLVQEISAQITFMNWKLIRAMDLEDTSVYTAKQCRAYGVCHMAALLTLFVLWFDWLEFLSLPLWISMVTYSVSADLVVWEVNYRSYWEQF